MLALDLLPLYEREAKERQQEAGKEHGRGQEQKVSAKMREAIEKGKAAEHAAKVVGVSPRYINYAKELNGRSPELLQEARRGEITLSEAMKQQPANMKQGEGVPVSAKMRERGEQLAYKYANRGRPSGTFTGRYGKGKPPTVSLRIGEQEAGKEHGRGQEQKVSVQVREAIEKGKATEHVAKLVGVGASYIERGEEVPVTAKMR